MNHFDYTIRLETPADYAEVEALTREAFWNVYRPGCLEHYVLHCLRNGHVGIFCVSVFRQNQEYHVINVHDGAYFPCLRLPETLLQGNQPV